MFTPILIALPILLIAFLGWRHLSKSGKVPSLELGASTKKYLLIGVGLVVVGILLYVGLNMFGGLLEGLPLNVWWFWPTVIGAIVLILLVAFKGTRKFATNILGSLGVIVIATAIGTSGGLLVGTSANAGGSSIVSKELGCSSQHNDVIPEGGNLTVTLCSSELQTANRISVRRTGPKDVTIKFADSTIALYGDRLKGSSPEHFYFKVEPGHMGSNFFFDLVPNNEEFKKRGMSHIPLDFIIEYKVGGAPRK